MIFDRYLRESHRRPFRLRMFGYGVSLGLHGPPLTLFLVSWLTRALLMDSTLELDEPAVHHVVFYRVPMNVSATFPGLTTAGLGTGTPGSVALERHGTTGPVRRRTRRPLLVPRPRKIQGPALEATPLGPDEMADDGPNGDGGTAEGAQAGDGGGGPGLLALGPGGVGRAQALEARKLARARHPRTEIETEDDQEFSEDDEAQVGTPLKGHPMRISMDHAAYLRTYETYPSPLPESCWPPGRTTNSMFIEICVGEAGDVSDVVVRQSAGPEADTMITDAIRSWRYRPRVVQGTPQPFCHPIRIVYKRELRPDRRW